VRRRTSPGIHKDLIPGLETLVEARHEASDLRVAGRRAAWCRQLAEIASKPLATCPKFPQIARRWEAWWRFEADRPLLVGTVATPADIRWDKAFDLLDDPECWLAVRKAQLAHQHSIGDTVPSIRADLGPVAPAAFLGAGVRFSRQDNTTWQSPIIEDWSDGLAELDLASPWLLALLAVARRTAADAAGKHLLSMPDLSGAMDIVVNLRGTERVLTDLYDAPQAVLSAVETAVEAWEKSFVLFYDAALSRGAGLTTWLYAWSNEPYTVPTCDFNAMLGPKQFAEFCLPSLVEQARRAGRCLFHLDGPDAARHAEALAAEEAITAVQYTPGAGTPSAVARLDMLRMLQSAGKPLFLFCPVEEVPTLIDGLDSRGLVLCPLGVQSPQHADELVRMVGGN